MWSSGVKWKLPSDVLVSVGVYRNGYFHALDPIGGARDFTLDRTILDRRSTIAAAGLEVGISRPLTRKLGGFLSYTLSRSEQSSKRLHSVSGFDRPHVLQLALSYDFGAGIRAGGRAILYSGVPELNLEGSPHFSTERRGAPTSGSISAPRSGGAWRNGVAQRRRRDLERDLHARSHPLDCGSICVERFAGPVILPSVGVEAGF
jgi:hypothetical protein